MLCETVFASSYLLDFRRNLLPQSLLYVDMFQLFPALSRLPCFSSPSRRHYTVCYWLNNTFEAVFLYMYIYPIKILSNSRIDYTKFCVGDNTNNNLSFCLQIFDYCKRISGLYCDRGSRWFCESLDIQEWSSRTKTQTWGPFARSCLSCY